MIQTTYDIIKAHGGEIKVETKEARLDDPVGQGEGTTLSFNYSINLKTCGNLFQ